MSQITIKDIVTITKGTLVNCNDDSVIINASHSLESPTYKAHSFAYIRDKKYLDNLNAGACDLVLTDERHAKLITNPKIAQVIVPDSYVAFAKVSQAIDPTPVPQPGIHPTAVVPKSCKIGKDVHLGAYVVLGENCVIGDNSIIESHCSLGDNCQLGKNVYLHPHVVLYHSVVLGDFAVVHSLSVLGADGFGYANERGKWVKIPQIGTTRIGNHSEIGSLTSIDRGAIKDTIVEDDVIIDNHIHIGHNCKVGMGTAMAGGTIVAGSTEFGKYCVIGGASVFNGHIKIADFVSVTGMAMVPHSLTEPKQIYSSGIPVDENRKWLKSTILLKYDNLAKRAKSLKALEQKTEQLSQQIEELKQLLEASKQ